MSGTTAADRLLFSIDPELTAQIRSLARQEGVTLFMVLSAALRVTLAAYGEQDDIVIGTAVANRTQVEVEPLIGCFANTLLLRAPSTTQQTFRELLCTERRVTLDAYENQDVPFEMLVQMIQPERSLERAPLHAMLVLHNVEAHALQLPGLTLQTIDMPPAHAKFDLTLIASESAGGLRCSIEYASELFARETVVMLQQMFETVLRAPTASVTIDVGAIRRDLNVLLERRDAERAARVQEASLRKLYVAQRRDRTADEVQPA